MGVAEELCNELFRWIDEQKQCADHLMALAFELENMREAVTGGQLLVNTATVLGSLALVGTGFATLVTGGAAAPLLALTAGVTAGVGTAASVTLSLVEKWKSSSTMEKAGKKADEIKQIQNNIERLQKKLQEECERQCSDASSSDDVQREITARILKALAKRSDRHLSLSHLRYLLRSDDMDTHHIYPEFNLDPEFFVKVGRLLAVLGLPAAYLCVKIAAKQGQKLVIPVFVIAAEEMGALALKVALKGAGQAAGGIFGLIFAVPDLIDNCEELIKNKHETKASKSLKTKAKEIREAVIELKKQLKELQEMLKQIPEMECHIDLYQEMFGSQIYTRGTICMEYKQTRKQERKTQKFILLSTKDIGETEHDSAGEDKSGDNKNKTQKKADTSSEDQQKKPDQKKTPDKSEKKGKEFKFCLPEIIMSNVRSLPKKRKDLKNLLKQLENFGLVCITETWLNDNSPSISLDGYEILRADRVARLTNKGRGGGLMMIVNKAWATNVEVENIINTPDYELMAVSIKPHDHPKGAPPLTFILVYIPPGGNKTQAKKDITRIFEELLKKYPGGPVFLLGDFNHCDFSHLNLEQFVTCPTRINNILDMCFGNVPGAFRSFCRPPLGRSDHEVILLIPKDKSDKSDSSKDEKCTRDHKKNKKQ